jgi:hypothetical protein
MKKEIKDAANFPEELRKAAVEYAKMKTGVNQPVKEHRVYIDAFKECFIVMQNFGMVSEKYKK